MVFVFLALGFFLAPLYAQEARIAVERDQVLSKLGGGGLLNIELTAQESGPGVVFKRTVSRPEARVMRFRFSISEDSEDWSIVIKNAAGASVWSVSAGQIEHSPFWSPEISGHHFSVELTSTSAHTRAHIVLDRVISDVQISSPISIVEPDKRKPIRDALPWMEEMGRSVARLRFVSDVDGKPYGCTAFLVANDLLLTNEHCIRTETELRSGLVDFDYDESSSPKTALPLSEIVATNVALDFAVLRLTTSVDRPALAFDTTEVSDNEDLVVIQHPERQPKQISLEDCRVAGAKRVGTTSSRTDFGHTCDTLGGSSGSPVVRIATRRVVGLHHLGIPEGGSTPVNRAAHMRQVVAKLPAAAGGQAE